MRLCLDSIIPVCVLSWTLFLKCVHGYYSYATEETIVSGKIRGERLKPDWSLDYFHVFKGIPYAQPPVGALRFQPPAKVFSWRGVMNTTHFPPACLQKVLQNKNSTFGGFRRHRQSEDCLYLNVFAPSQRWNETFPIMVWIHGGDFQIGSSGDYRQEYILRNFVSRKVVFVTLNYRLGPLGFLSTGDSVVPGNLGLWDIIMALKWIQENGVKFGGNVDSVTLIGHGSGGGAASLLGLSKETDGLIHRIISLSGTALSPGLVRDVAVNATKNLKTHLGCLAENSTEIVNWLKQRSQNELFDPSRPRVYYDEYEEWVPIVDGYKGVIPEPPELLAEHRVQYPTLTGTTLDESALHLIVIGKPGINMSAPVGKEISEYLVRNLTNSYRGFSNVQLITESCYFEYVRTLTNPRFQEEVLKNGILQLYSDFYYHSPATRLVSIYADVGIPAYLYSFDHISRHVHPVSTDWRGKEFPAGAFHGSDLIFLFGLENDIDYIAAKKDIFRQIDWRVTEVYADLLTNFAKYGNPTPKGSPYANWTVFDRKRRNYYSITDKPEEEVGFHWRGDTFWNDYARKLDKVDVGNWRYIATLKKELNDYQLATWVLLSSALFFFAILIGLACYCMRKDADDEEI